MTFANKSHHTVILSRVFCHPKKFFDGKVISFGLAGISFFVNVSH